MCTNTVPVLILHQKRNFWALSFKSFTPLSLFVANSVEQRANARPQSLGRRVWKGQVELRLALTHQSSPPPPQVTIQMSFMYINCICWGYLDVLFRLSYWPEYKSEGASHGCSSHQEAESRDMTYDAWLSLTFARVGMNGLIDGKESTCDCILWSPPQNGSRPVITFPLHHPRLSVFKSFIQEQNRPTRKKKPVLSTIAEVTERLLAQHLRVRERLGYSKQLGSVDSPAENESVKVKVKLKKKKGKKEKRKPSPPLLRVHSSSSRKESYAYFHLSPAAKDVYKALS